jgi:hypothetical protein
MGVWGQSPHELGASPRTPIPFFVKSLFGKLLVAYRKKFNHAPPIRFIKESRFSEVRFNISKKGIKWYKLGNTIFTIGAIAP